MYPKSSYQPFPKCCRHCKYVAFSTKTSFLRKGPEDDKWFCTRNGQPPSLPEEVFNNMYVDGYLSSRARQEAGEPPIKKASPEVVNQKRQEYELAKKDWEANNQVSPEGVCDEWRQGSNT